MQGGMVWEEVGEEEGGGEEAAMVPVVAAVGMVVETKETGGAVGGMQAVWGVTRGAMEEGVVERVWAWAEGAMGGLEWATWPTLR
jgi:hypothetical protein